MIKSREIDGLSIRVRVDGGGEALKVDNERCLRCRTDAGQVDKDVQSPISVLLGRGFDPETNIGRHFLYCKA